MQLFFSEIILDNVITLDEEESKHCTKVLRKKVGDTIEVVDGKGNYYTATIAEDNFKAVMAVVKSTTKNWRVKNYKIAIAMALSKNPDRFEWFCEKATEIGVDEIFPVVTERTERRQFKPERIHKILLSAMKQSGKALLPKLHDVVDYSMLIKQSGKYNHYQKFIGWCETDEGKHLKHLYEKGNSTLVLIGPEGDFTKQEVDMAIARHFQPVSLGHSRLRMETAGVVACHIVNLGNE
jgi:16S rRNA (uracil1498-N3)-methyltransferase